MNNNTTFSDKELIDQYIAGNTAAFNTLVIKYKNKIYTLISILVKDPNIAEDIFQDVFVRIIETITSGRYNDEGKFLNWAQRIAHNMCMDYFRRKKHNTFYNNYKDNDTFEIVDLSEKNIEQKIINNEIEDNIRKKLERLPKDQREVIILRHYADLSFKEIAALTNCSINTSLGRMRYGLTNLRKLNEEFQFT